MQESDWKVLSKLRPLAVERMYDRIFFHLQSTLNAEEKSHREAVIDTLETVRAAMKEVSRVFDQVRFSRTNASDHLITYFAENLLTEQELAEFSEDAQELVSSWRAQKH
ncbi:hypothetical protein [Pseudomonas sp.]|uniref:hypothetical protein n=1 Tax=Pseudomonas sp. TaxID=306 RepID=UPI0026195F59|nr:hypothetical protein [Pseudomonas sp.]